MNIRYLKNSLPLLALLLFSSLAHAAKVVGTCKADVTGPKQFTISGKLYEGQTPDGTIQSFASTRAWALEWAEEYRKTAPQMADMKKKMANEMLFALSITCASDKGRVQFMPTANDAKSADYPSGPKTYTLVGDNMREPKSGDVNAMILSQEFQTGSIQPAEPGELKITQNDGEKLVATFSFKSKSYTVKGSIDFSRPKEIAK